MVAIPAQKSGALIDKNNLTCYSVDSVVCFLKKRLGWRPFTVVHEISHRLRTLKAHDKKRKCSSHFRLRPLKLYLRALVLGTWQPNTDRKIGESVLTCIGFKSVAAWSTANVSSKGNCISWWRKTVWANSYIPGSSWWSHLGTWRGENAKCWIVKLQQKL